MAARTSIPHLSPRSRGLAAALLCGMVLFAGCASVEPPDPVSKTGGIDREYLVQRAVFEWVANRSEEEYDDAEIFFADPPVADSLMRLANSSRTLGYDFTELRDRTWAYVQAIHHEGQ